MCVWHYRLHIRNGILRGMHILVPSGPPRRRAGRRRPAAPAALPAQDAGALLGAGGGEKGIPLGEGSYFLDGRYRYRNGYR